MVPDASAAIDALYRSDWGGIVATLIRFVGDFDVAEEAAQEAFAAAVDEWQNSGVPKSPRAWLIQAGRHKAIDRIRRRARRPAAVDSSCYGLGQNLARSTAASLCLKALTSGRCTAARQERRTQTGASADIAGCGLSEAQPNRADLAKFHLLLIASTSASVYANRSKTIIA